MTTTFHFDKRIRPSSLPQWPDCARRSFARSFPDLVSWAGYELRSLEPSVGAAVGSGVHAGAAYMLEEKMKSGETGAEKEAVERAVTEFDSRVRDEGVIWDSATESRNTAHTQLQRMTHVYREGVAPNLYPILIEERLEATIGDGWYVSGQLDTLSQAPGALHDLKTGTLKRSNALQYGTYKMLFSAHGYEVAKIYEDFVPRVPLRKEQPWPEAVEIPVDVAETEAWIQMERVKGMVDQFVELALQGGPVPPETALPANPQSVLCSSRYCPAWGTSFCRLHRSE